MRSAGANKTLMYPPRASKLPQRKLLFVVMQVLATIVLTAAVLHFVDLSRVWVHLRQTTAYVADIIVCLILSVLQIAILVCRLYLILKSVAGRAAVQPVILATLNERVVNQLLPSTIGGDAVRVSYLYGATAKIGASVITVLFDRLAGIAGLGVICAGAGLLAYAVGFQALPVQSTSAIAGVAVLLAGLGLLVPPSWVIRSSQLPILWRFQDYVLHWARVSRSATFLLATVALSIITQLIFCLVFVVLARAIAPGVSVVALVILVPTIIITNTIPLTVAGWGMRENASVILFAFAGIDADVAVAISVLFGTVQLLTAIGCWLTATILVLREK